MFWKGLPFFVSLTLAASLAAADPGKITKTESIDQGIGVAVSIHPAPGAKSSPDKAIRKAVEEAKRLYQELDLQSSGEVSRINKSAGEGKIKVSGPMLTLLRVCMQISQWTQGLFDIVRTSNKKEAALQVDFGKSEVQLPERKSWVDLGGIRNGYVVDRMAGVLKAEGYNDFMIVLAVPKGAAGAVVRTMGRDGKDYWRHNVADPNGSGKELCRVSLEASSVATADIRAHPKPATDLQSVTIITRNATNATALARTGLLVGKERARSMFAGISEPGFGAILEDRYGKIATIGDVTAACFEE